MPYQPIVGSTSGYIAEVDALDRLKVVCDTGVAIGTAAQLVAAPPITTQNRPDQALRVAVDGTSLFFDGFDSYDVTDKWLANAGASVTPTVANGLMVINPGTTLGGWTMIRSQPTFPNQATAYLNPGFVILINPTITTKNYRFWGLGTAPATPTLAAPMTDGIGFEILTTGELQAVVWANGSKTFSQVITRPSDNNYHRYSVYYKSSRVYWMYDSQDVYVATATTSSSGYTPPVVQTLPLLMLSVNDPSTAPTVNGVAATAPAFVIAAVLNADTGRNAIAVSDGVFGWRKARVGEGPSGDEGSLHIIPKPVPTSIGAYRVSVRTGLINGTVANARLFEIRNSHATNLIIPTRLVIRCTQMVGVTVGLETSIDVFKVTGFTAVDTVNTQTPTASVKRLVTPVGWTAAPGSAQIRAGTDPSGTAAGMITGSTLVKDGGTIAQLPVWLSQTIAGNQVSMLDVFDDVNGTYPFVFAQNEGLLIENRIAIVTNPGMRIIFEFSWTEVLGY